MYVKIKKKKKTKKEIIGKESSRLTEIICPLNASQYILPKKIVFFF